MYPLKLTQIKILVDSFKAAPKYLPTRLSQFFVQRKNVFVKHSNGHRSSPLEHYLSSFPADLVLNLPRVVPFAPVLQVNPIQPPLLQVSVSSCYELQLPLPIPLHGDEQVSHHHHCFIFMFKELLSPLFFTLMVIEMCNNSKNIEMYNNSFTLDGGRVI